jgi:hypothetical protein
MWIRHSIFSDPLQIQCNCNGMTWTRSSHCGVAFLSLYRRAATTWLDLVNYSYPFPLVTKYLPQHPSLEHPVPMFLLKFGEPTVHSCRANDKIIVLYVHNRNKYRELKVQDVSLTLLDISVSYWYWHIRSLNLRTFLDCYSVSVSAGIPSASLLSLICFSSSRQIPGQYPQTWHYHHFPYPVPFIIN